MLKQKNQNQKSKYIKLYNHIYNFSNKLSKEKHDNKKNIQIKIITVKKKKVKLKIKINKKLRFIKNLIYEKKIYQI